MIKVKVYGKGWYGQGISTEYTIRDIKGPREKVFAGDARKEKDNEHPRVTIARWLETNSGDFQSIDAWHAWEVIPAKYKVLAINGTIPEGFDDE